MRADRLLALVLVLRSRRRVTAAELAAELEVSERTVLRDIEALANAGVPVYAERGRHGGFRLMDGWSTDLSGLSGAEARSLLVAGSSTAAELGLGRAFATALAKVLSSVPGEHRREAELEAARILVVDDGFVSRRETLPALAATQRAVTGGRRLLISYRRRPDAPASRRTVDPAGLVCASGIWYLLATHRRNRRSYRVSRILEARVLDEPARRGDLPPIAQWWEQTRSEFTARFPVVQVELVAEQPAAAPLRAAALSVQSARPEPGGRTRLTLTFADREHAAGVLWRHADQIAVITPDWVRTTLAGRARDAAERHR